MYKTRCGADGCAYLSSVNSARVRYFRRKDIADTNTRVLRGLGKALTVKGMCIVALQDGVCLVAEEPFRCRDTGFPVVRERFFYGAEHAFPWCGRMVVASRNYEECPPECVLWRCGGY